jgi:hypothetical protein
VNKGHIARAALEAIAFQTREVLDAVNADTGVPLTELRVDGGATANNTMLQFQADILNVPVVRPVVGETTALGAAYAAGLAVGFWKDLDELRANWKEDQRWEPTMDDDERGRLNRNWDKAVTKTLDWVDDDVVERRGDLAFDPLQHVGGNRHGKGDDQDAAEEHDQLVARHLERVAHHQQATHEDDEREEPHDDLHASTLAGFLAALGQIVGQFVLCHEVDQFFHAAKQNRFQVGIRSDCGRECAARLLRTSAWSSCGQPSASQMPCFHSVPRGSPATVPAPVAPA